MLRRSSAVRRLLPSSVHARSILVRGVPWIAAVTALVLYTRAAAPGIVTFFDDSLEFQVVGPTLGIAHPTGYPLYTLLGALWTRLLPWGTWAGRMNLMSAVAAAAAVGIVANLGSRLGDGSRRAAQPVGRSRGRGRVWAGADLVEPGHHRRSLCAAWPAGRGDPGDGAGHEPHAGRGRIHACLRPADDLAGAALWAGVGAPSHDAAARPTRGRLSALARAEHLATAARLVAVGGGVGRAAAALPLYPAAGGDGRARPARQLCPFLERLLGSRDGAQLYRVLP